jgi:hypothetical protein
VFETYPQGYNPIENKCPFYKFYPAFVEEFPGLEFLQFRQIVIDGIYSIMLSLESEMKKETTVIFKLSYDCHGTFTSQRLNRKLGIYITRAKSDNFVKEITDEICKNLNDIAPFKIKIIATTGFMYNIDINEYDVSFINGVCGVKGNFYLSNKMINDKKDKELERTRIINEQIAETRLLAEQTFNDSLRQIAEIDKMIKDEQVINEAINGLLDISAEMDANIGRMEERDARPFWKFW